MRSLPDRIRHTVLFEVIALALVATVGSWIIGRTVIEMGVLSLMFSVMVMFWNLLYNWLFDLWDQKYRDLAKRGVGIRLVHAVLFELGVLTFGIFLVAWWLDMTLWQALLLDIGFAVFFIAYAFAYNWAYDIAFPVARA